MTPLDVVKVRLQAQTRPLQKGNCFIYCNNLVNQLCVCLSTEGAAGGSIASNELHWYNRPNNFLNTRDAFLKIIRYEGVPALWSGLAPTLAMALPQTVVYYTINDMIKLRLGFREASVINASSPSTLSSPLITSNDLIPPFVGGLSRVFALSLFSPIELVRTKVMSLHVPMTYRQLASTVRDAVREGGVRSLWRGLGPSMYRDVPFSMIFWFMFDFQRNHLLPMLPLTAVAFDAVAARVSTLPTQDGAGHTPAPQQDLFSTELRLNFLFGAVAGIVAGIVTLPFDVIKTHRQIELGEGVAYKKRSSTWQALNELYLRKGIHGLYSGIVPRVIKVAPACSIMVGSFELVKSYFVSSAS